jgi:hypothetical protein
VQSEKGLKDEDRPSPIVGISVNLVATVFEPLPPGRERSHRSADQTRAGLHMDLPLEDRPDVAEAAKKRDRARKFD